MKKARDGLVWWSTTLCGSEIKSGVTGAFKSMDTRERERKAAAARLRFEEATRDIASERRFGGPDGQSTELEMMDEALLLIRQARQDKNKK